MLECADIRRILPHGHPMILVDRVLDLDRGRSIVATKSITVGELCFQRLAPDAPLHCYRYPASLLLESFGQAAALLWLHGTSRAAMEDGDVLMLAAARNCEIEGSALPGDTVRHVARIEHVVGDNTFVSGASYIGERRIASIGSMVAVMRSRATLAGRR